MKHLPQRKIVNWKCAIKSTEYKIINFFLAPGSYDVVKAEKLVHESAGAITFGMKYKEQKTDDIPG